MPGVQLLLPGTKEAEKRILLSLPNFCARLGESAGQRRMIELRDKFSGCLVGSAVGDAIGELAFHFSSKERLEMKLDRLKELIYTDDTAMTIGLGESLIKKGYLDTQDLGERFRHNFKNEPWRGYASGLPTIFSMV